MQVSSIRSFNNQVSFKNTFKIATTAEKDKQMLHELEETAREYGATSTYPTSTKGAHYSNCIVVLNNPKLDKAIKSFLSRYKSDTITFEELKEKDLFDAQNFSKRITRQPKDMREYDMQVTLDLDKLGISEELMQKYEKNAQELIADGEEITIPRIERDVQAKQIKTDNEASAITTFVAAKMLGLKTCPAIISDLWRHSLRNFPENEGLLVRSYSFNEDFAELNDNE